MFCLHCYLEISYMNLENTHQRINFCKFNFFSLIAGLTTVHTPTTRVLCWQLPLTWSYMQTKLMGHAHTEDAYLCGLNLASS